MFAQTCPGIPISDQNGTFSIFLQKNMYVFHLKSLRQNVLHVLAKTAYHWTICFWRYFKQSPQPIRLLYLPNLDISWTSWIFAWEEVKGTFLYLTFCANMHRHTDTMPDSPLHIADLPLTCPKILNCPEFCMFFVSTVDVCNLDPTSIWNTNFLLTFLDQRSS